MFVKLSALPSHYRKADVFSLLNQYVGYPIFTVFLSTNSSLSNLAPPSRQAKSSRARNASEYVQAITEVPFDCSPGFYVEPDTLTWQDVSKIQVEFMAQFGRPL